MKCNNEVESNGGGKEAAPGGWGGKEAKGEVKG